MPGGVDLVGALHYALAMARAAHHRLHNAGKADLLHRLAEFLLRVGEAERGGRQTELHGGEIADLAAVHGDECGARGRHHVPSLFFKSHESRSGNRLDLRNDIVGLLLLHYAAQGVAVEHRDHDSLVGHEHRRGVGIFVESHHFHTIALEFYRHLFTKFAASEKKSFLAVSAERTSDFYHF